MAGWQRTLYILAFSQLLSSIGFSMIFPFLPNFVESLGTNTNISLVFWAGAVFSAQAITMAVSAPVWGAVADRYGRKPMVVRAMFGGAIVTFLMGYAQSAEMLVLLRAVQGLVTGVASAGNAMVASIAPRERTGYAMGVLQTASWSGVAVGPVIGGILADTFGYRMAFTVTGALLMVGGFIVTLGIHEKFTPVPRRKGQGGLLAGWKRILRRPGIGDTFLARFTSNLARGLLVPILPLFIPIVLHGQGAIGTFTGLVIGVSSATGTIAAIVLGNLGDRTGHRRILIISALVAAASYIPMAFVTEGWQLLLLNALSGIATGGLMPALSALLVRYTAEEEVGSAFGLDNSVMSAARAAAPLLAVGTVSLLGYQAVFFLGALIFLITLAITIWKLPEPDQPRRPRELQRDAPA